MIPAEKIIVALDTNDSSTLTSLFLSLKGHPVWVKIGMELYYSLGPDVINEAKKHELKVFLDLKLHDIPNTVGKAMAALSKLPIDMINVHAAGGSEMMKRAREAVGTDSNSPLLIAVTQLTSTTQEQMNREQMVAGEIQQSVVHYAHLAQSCGLDGVVSSPLEVRSIKEKCGAGFLTVTPGIRPKGGQLQDQKRVTTPDEALKLGTDFMVIGRPITQAKNPRAALESILRGEA